jgi:hypothetical protein
MKTTKINRLEIFYPYGTILLVHFRSVKDYTVTSELVLLIYTFLLTEQGPVILELELVVLERGLFMPHPRLVTPVPMVEDCPLCLVSSSLLNVYTLAPKERKFNPQNFLPR